MSPVERFTLAIEKQLNGHGHAREHPARGEVESAGR